MSHPDALTSMQGVQLTQHLIDEYLNDLLQSGTGQATITTYRSYLHQLYKFLPASKIIEEDTSRNWQADMERRGTLPRTILSRVYALNGFLDYLGKPEWRVEKRRKKPVPPEPEGITRNEYLLLLQTARIMGRKRAYLLIKTIVNAGLKTQELPDLTVEALQRGTAMVFSYGIQRCVPIPELLCRELLNYAAEMGVRSGPIFITKDGTPMVHSGVWKEIKTVCRRTGLAEEAGNPRSLYRLYLSTYRELCVGPANETELRCRRLLEAEETSVAWNV